MKHTILILTACLVSATVFAEPGYSHLWWAHGFRGEKFLHVQTDHYGAVFEPERGAITNLGPIPSPVSYGDAAEQVNSVVTSLPEVSLLITVRRDGKTYTCTRAAQALEDHINYPVRLLDGGRYMNRFDVLGLEFYDDQRNRLDVEGRLEVSAWPEHMVLAVFLTGPEPTSPVDVSISLKGGGMEEEEAARFDGPWLLDGAPACTLMWPPDEASGDTSSITVTDGQDYGAPLAVVHDDVLGAHYVTIPGRSWAMADDLDHLDRFPVTISNESDRSITYPIVFGIVGPFQGVTGMVPMLRDSDGNPSGIPVQISKNWHRRVDHPLIHEGPWFHGVTEITVPAQSVWKGEYAITYARWGGVPSASHSQLCLVGWGGNQRWDQAAIGSFGESITYDPDIGLNRSMIDDVRPLMVTGMNGGQWEWTHNVGGGDFLRYEVGGKRQYLSGVKTAYLSQGPNLTDVIYAGESADGKIAARIEVQTPRTDDVNRQYHRIRYDVREPVTFSRLAFYQLGADNYNDHEFTTIARGNKDGLVEEWETERGGKKYLRDAMAADGTAPWIAMLGGIRTEKVRKVGAWADRAIVIRSWKARLGGKDIADPYFAIYGTENGPASALAELAPPPGVTQLEPGDFVEAEIELLIVPQNAEDYYGPNQVLRADLAEHGGTWQTIHRLAVANDIAVNVSAGSLMQRLPVVIGCANDRAGCTMEGGAGYMPITFTGVTKPKGFQLTVDGVVVDQHVHGNDFWQVIPDGDGYRVTYNVPLDGEPRVRTIVFGPAE